MISEHLPDGHHWFHVIDPSWSDSLDVTHAGTAEGRWNPPRGVPTVYLTESMTAARADVVRLLADTPLHPEDFRDDAGPALAEIVLPKRQTVVDAHTNGSLAALSRSGKALTMAHCQAISAEAHAAGLRGVRARSTEAAALHERKLAWFPTSRSKADVVRVVPFGEWWYAREPKPPRPE